MSRVFPIKNNIKKVLKCVQKFKMWIIMSIYGTSIKWLLNFVKIAIEGKR